MEEQRAQTGEQQRVAYRRPVSTGTKMVAPEHREHVLDAQHKHARLAKGGRVVNGGWVSDSEVARAVSLMVCLSGRFQIVL